MFVIPCKFNNDVPIIFECVEHIKKNYPHEKIVVVDSCSDDKSYFSKLDVFDIIEGNTNYEIGAYLKAFEKYPNENFYYNIHDSVLVNSIIPLNCNIKTLQYFDCIWDSYEQKEYGRSVIGDNVDSTFYGCFGSIFFTSNTIMKSVYEFFKDKHLPTKKSESCAYERILGIFFYMNGYDIRDSIQGKHINFEHCYDTSLIQKIFLKRQ